MLRIDINMLFTVINVLILFVAIRIFLWKPIHKILDQRQNEVEQAWTGAHEAQAEAAALTEEKQKALDASASECAAALDEAHEKAAEEGAQLIAAAQTEAKQILSQAQTEAQKQKELVMQQAQSEISEIILTASAKLSGVGKDSELYDEFLKKAGDKHE